MERRREGVGDGREQEARGAGTRGSDGEKEWG